MDAAARPSGYVAEAVVLAALGALLVAAVFAGGGSRGSALATVGLAALIAAAIGVVAALRGILPVARLDRAGSLAVVAAAALVAWAGLSTAWSIAGDHSWEWFGRGLVYLSFLALGLLAGSLVAGARRVAAVIGRRARRGARLGPPRSRDPLPLRGRRPDRAPPRAGRILERARAPRRRCAGDRPLARARPETPGSRRRSAPRLRGGARAAPHPVAVGPRRRSPRPRPLARALRQEARGRVSPRAPRRPGARRRRLGLHASGARRGGRAPRRPGRRRPGLRDPRR